MGAGAIQIYRGRRLIVDGKTARAEACCCGAATTIYKLTPCMESAGCGNCADGQGPKYLTVTFPGVEFSPCQADPAGYDHSLGWINTPAWGGTYVLTGSGCAWTYTGDAAGEWGWFPGTTCSEDPWGEGLGVVNELEIGLEFTSATTVDVWAEFHRRWGTAAYAYEAPALVFLAEGKTWDCGEATWQNANGPIATVNPSPPYWPFAGTGGAVHILPGDILNPNTSCPGGDPIYTHTDLSAHLDRVVKLADGVWYAVTVDGSTSDGAVTILDTADSCQDVCP